MTPSAKNGSQRQPPPKVKSMKIPKIPQPWKNGCTVEII